MPSWSESFKRAAVATVFPADSVEGGALSRRVVLAVVCACGAPPQDAARRAQARVRQHTVIEGSCTETLASSFSVRGALHKGGRARLSCAEYPLIVRKGGAGRPALKKCAGEIHGSPFQCRPTMRVFNHEYAAHKREKFTDPWGDKSEFSDAQPWSEAGSSTHFDPCDGAAGNSCRYKLIIDCGGTERSGKREAAKSGLLVRSFV